MTNASGITADPFSLMGLPRAFDIDSRALHAAYLQRSAALHPDRIHDPLQQAEAQREAAALNDAHATLADDEQRANVLLALLGGPAKEQDKALPDAFLPDIMAMREDMEAALAEGSADERRRIETRAAEHREQHVTAVRAMFASLHDPPQPEHLAAIRRELNAWRYVERMLQQLRDA